MASKIILVTSTVLDAARCMRDLRATALAVQGHDGSLRGIVSEQDLIKRCFLKGLSAATTTVEAVMTRSVEFVTESDARSDIGAVQKRLAEMGVKHMPMVADEPDDNGVLRVVGCLDILSVSALVRDRAVQNMVSRGLATARPAGLPASLPRRRNWRRAPRRARGPACRGHPPLHPFTH